jgi:ABC-2 type transport system ATP-binding protein
VRMEEWRDVPVHKYSKGMMQRLGMAQAILNHPDLLILDEPTDGVDPIGRREIRDLLLEQRERGATIFLNSHLLSEVERLCDRVAILRDGVLLREGEVSDLTRPKSVFQIETRPSSPGAVEAALERAPALRRALTTAPVPGAPPVVVGTPPVMSGPSPVSGSSAVSGSPQSVTRLELAGDVPTLNQAIDALRAGGVAITSILPRRDSLEDVFVRVLEEGEPQ